MSGLNRVLRLYGMRFPEKRELMAMPDPEVEALWLKAMLCVMIWNAHFGFVKSVTHFDHEVMRYGEQRPMEVAG